jgi:uncharacterized membrane protein
MIYWMGHGKTIEETIIVDNDAESAVAQLNLDEETHGAVLAMCVGDGDVYIGYDPFDFEIRGEYSYIITEFLSLYEDEYSRLASDI